ncbi:hypothetical protein FQR65_LT08621 [Abscondita terminalis]|nr:hypothetical protein FQR65_LT08621 [Abscondita terminalis]
MITDDDRSDVFFYDDMLWFGTKAEQRLNTFFTPFFMETWILIVVVFILVVLIWWRGLLLENFKSTQLQALSQSFSEIISLLFGVGIPAIPQLTSLKILILFYLTYIIHIQTAYTSDMINTLVVPQYEHVVSNVHDLVESGIPTVIQEDYYKFFFNEDLKDFHVYNEIKRNLIQVYRYDEAKNYSNQKLFIALSKQYYMFNFDRNPKKITNKFISNDVTGSFRVSFFMLPGNYLLCSINRVIACLREFGFYEKAYEDGYRLRNTENRKLIDYKFDISEVEDWNDALRINDFVGVFIVLSIGYTSLRISRTENGPQIPSYSKASLEPFNHMDGDNLVFHINDTKGEARWSKKVKERYPELFARKNFEKDVTLHKWSKPTLLDRQMDTKGYPNTLFYFSTKKSPTVTGRKAPVTFQGDLNAKYRPYGAPLTRTSEERQFSSRPPVVIINEENMIEFTDEHPHVLVNISNKVRQVYDKHGNNFILQARTIYTLEKLIITFLNHNSFKFRENHRGRFIIVTQEKNISEVFLLMWELFASNSVVLHYDDTDKNKDLIIYTSNPFSYPNSCGTKANDIHAEFCDSDVIVRFPKVIKNFGGCNFTFGSYNLEHALSYINPFTYSLHSTLNEIQLMLNLTIRHLFVTSDKHDQEKNRNRHYFGSFQFQRVTNDDRTDIFFYDDWVWFGNQADQSLNTFFTPFFMETWILIVVVFVFVVVIWWRGLVLEKFKDHQLHALFQSFSEISSLLFGVGISVLPKLISLKILILFYLIYIIHIQTAYTSDMINTLVVPKYEHVVSNLHDLVESGIPTMIHDHYYEHYFSSDLENFYVYNEIKRKSIIVQDYNEVKNYSNQKLFILLPKQLYKFNYSTELKKTTNKFISNDITGSMKVSFFMIRGNYLLSSINRVIAFLREFGFYEKAYADGCRLRNKTIVQIMDYNLQLSEVDDWSNALRINDFIGLFIILSVGFIASIVILLLEILINRYFSRI